MDASLGQFGEGQGPLFRIRLHKIKHIGLQRKPIILQYRYQNMKTRVCETVLYELLYYALSIKI